MFKKLNNKERISKKSGIVWFILNIVLIKIIVSFLFFSFLLFNCGKYVLCIPFGSAVLGVKNHKNLVYFFKFDKNVIKFLDTW